MDSFNMLNEYLMSRDVKYYVSDTDVANAKTVIFNRTPVQPIFAWGNPCRLL